MKRAYAIAFVLAVAAASAAAETPPIKVTVDQLLARPRKFDGRRVDVTGFYRASLEDSSLLASARAAAGPWDTKNAIWVEPDIWDPRYHKQPAANISDADALTGHQVRAIGMFRYRPNVHRRRETRPDGREFISQEPLGYGHMRLWAAALFDVTHFQRAR